MATSKKTEPSVDDMRWHRYRFGNSSTKMPEQVVIYDHPIDFPKHWVVRRVRIGAGVLYFDTDQRVFDTVESAREHIHMELPGAVCIQHEGQDADPKIFEVWM